MSKQIQLSHYLESGMPKVSDFNLVEVNVEEPKNNQVLVKNCWMSVDPYMRGRMINRKSYVPPFQLNSPLEGGAIGVVTASNSDDFQVGDYVSSFYGWREYFVAHSNELKMLNAKEEELPHFLGALGMPGLTAYAGLLHIGKPQSGETVFVSAASGAVGSIVCQIAKLKGCKVIASAGSEEKVAWLKHDLNVDAVINYKTCGSLNEALRDAAPNGIDVYFENVGGEHLQAALNHMNLHGRIVMCGLISQYNLDKPDNTSYNLMQIIGKRLTIQGFIVSDFESQSKEFYLDMSKWLKAGDIKIKESIREGIENAPQAFIDLFHGENFGKMMVKL